MKIDIQLTQADIVKLIVAGLEVSGHVDKDEIKPESVIFRYQGSQISNITAEVAVFSDGHYKEPACKQYDRNGEKIADGTTMKKYEPKEAKDIIRTPDGIWKIKDPLMMGLEY